MRLTGTAAGDAGQIGDYNLRLVPDPRYSESYEKLVRS